MDRIERINQRMEEYQKELATIEGKTLRGMQLEMRLDGMAKNKKDYLNNVEIYKKKKSEYDEMNLFEMGEGKNTHEIGSKGFKNGVPISRLGNDWKIEFRGDRSDFLSYRSDGRGVSSKDWDNKFKGQTIIHSNVTKNSDEDIKELEDEIKHVWNNVLTDEQRGGVDILHIKYSDTPTWRKKGENKVRTLGTFGSRKVFEHKDSNIMMSPSVLTINVTKRDQPNDVLNTMIHEVAHSMWAKNIKHDHEKVNKFTEKILSMGKENALTEYAGSYFDDLEEIKEKTKKDWEEEIDRELNHTYGKNDVQTEEEFQNWKNETTLKRLANRRLSANEGNKNILKAQRLIANETHSEYFGMVGSPTMDSYHTVDTVKLKEMSALIKEMLYG